MASGDPFLELGGIRKTFGRFEALKTISLAVARGELMVFLGPSGCGKTTLLRIIAGLEVQDTGTIVQDGRDVSRLPAIKRDYGIVFQSYALFPNLTIYDNVAYGLVNRRQGRGAIRKRVDELLALVGLPTEGAKYPGQLSGGQQQRIALARALAPAPGLLLLDEPLSALDALERVRLRGEIRALQKRLGVTTVMVTHDQEEALSMADRIVVMNQGLHRPGGHAARNLRDADDAVRRRFHRQGQRALRHRRRRRAVQGRQPFPRGRPRGRGVRDGGEALPASGGRRGQRRSVAASGVANSVAGKIAKVEFLGAFCMVGIQLEGGVAAPLLANVPRQQVDTGGLTPGAPVTVSLPPAAMRILG